ncbi:MAG: hypothetical protein HUJ61_00465 [Bacilli bacterium]|nr:hypothetical protein [Bacilli bacterium]
MIENIEERLKVIFEIMEHNNLIIKNNRFYEFTTEANELINEDFSYFAINDKEGNFEIIWIYDNEEWDWHSVYSLSLNKLKAICEFYDIISVVPEWVYTEYTKKEMEELELLNDFMPLI